MLYKVEELEKARTTYEGLLEHDADAMEALRALASIHSKIAVGQKAAGKDTEAAANAELATLYADRVSELSSRPNLPTSRRKVSNTTKARVRLPENSKSPAARSKIEATGGEFKRKP